MKLIYLDNAATTAVDKTVITAMEPYFDNDYGNPSEWHSSGRMAKIAVEESRNKIAKFLGSNPDEIVFTSCATESINLSHKGLVEAVSSDFKPGSKPNVVVTPIEHKAVLETCRHMEEKGEITVTYLPIDKYGLVNPEDIVIAIKPDTILVSVMYVNNEIGTVEPVAKIGDTIRKINKSGREHRIFFHTDATQAIQYLNCRVNFLGIDFLSFTGHKIYAPKGIGVLYVRQSTPLIRQSDGGDQERGLRAGTEDVPYIVGLGRAVEIAKRTRLSVLPKISRLRKRLMKGLLAIPGVKLTGHPVKRAPHIASFTVSGAEGEAMVLLLSDMGIIASSGSACTSARLTASHVLTAIGVSAETSHGSLRFSLGKETTESEIDEVIKKLPKVITKLRDMSPLTKL